MDFNKIYEEIARRHGTTVEEVRNEMQFALEAAWQNAQQSEEVRRKQKEISPDGETPSPEQFISYCVESIK